MLVLIIPKLLMSRYRLVIDERERNVFPTLELEMKSIKSTIPIIHEIKTITVGDYAIIDNRTEILIAVFERKTLKRDFPASIRDGRYANKEKMIAARQKTGCRLYYLVEGPLDPALDTYFSRIPYKTIESAMFHLEMRDGFHIMRTKDINDTINKLIRFIYSLETVDPVAVIKSACTDEINSLEIAENGNITNVTNTTNLEKIEELNNLEKLEELNNKEPETEEPKLGAMQILTEKHEKRDIDILREMWACFTGISISSSDMYLSKFTLKEIIRGEIPSATINALKTPTGREITRNVKKVLNNPDEATTLRMLSKVPGISTPTAKELIQSAGSLRALLSYDPAAISIMKIGAKKRNLGSIKAERIMGLFNMKDCVRST